MRVKASHQEQFCMASNVFLLCSRFKRNNARAKLYHMLTKESFFVAESNNGSIISNPKIIPKTPPRYGKCIFII